MVKRAGEVGESRGGRGGKTMNVEVGREVYANYNQVLSGLVNMINNPSPWLRNH
jgi:hypothetical protein